MKNKMEIFEISQRFIDHKLERNDQLTHEQQNLITHFLESLAGYHSFDEFKYDYAVEQEDEEMFRIYIGLRLYLYFQRRDRHWLLVDFSHFN